MCIAHIIHTLALKADGTVLAAGWRRSVGVKTDGTVVAVGRMNEGACDVADWRDIKAVSAGDWHTLGLQRNGQVVAVGKIVAVGDNRYNQCTLKEAGTYV